MAGEVDIDHGGLCYGAYVGGCGCDGVYHFASFRWFASAGFGARLRLVGWGCGG
jgi:hypothetical protein